MKLELKHLAPYLPYDLPIEPLYKSMYQGGYHQKVLDTSILDNYEIEEIKPILRPLSDLTKEITVNGETFVPIAKFYSLTSVDLELINIEEWHEELIYLLKTDSPFKLSQFNMLLEWHFDIFGLIENGLAIDINTLQK